MINVDLTKEFVLREYADILGIENPTNENIENTSKERSAENGN